MGRDLWEKVKASSLVAASLPWHMEREFRDVSLALLLRALAADVGGGPAPPPKATPSSFGNPEAAQARASVACC